jgi:hypothetical protein
MPQLSELLDEAVGDQPVQFSTVDVRRRSRQLGVRRRARRVMSGATAVAISVGAAVTISNWADRGSSRRLPTTATRAATSTATLPTSTVSATSTLSSTSTLPATSTTVGIPSPHDLLAALRSDRFDGSSLPGHLHVLGVGPWSYVDAGHVGSGYIGSAEVRLRSDEIGESFGNNYDVFATPAGATAWFMTAYTNFRKFSPAGTFRVPRLTPSVNAFCGPQAGPANTTTCWFVRGVTTGIVTATIPTSASGGDTDAVLQAMVTHLVALGG